MYTKEDFFRDYPPKEHPFAFAWEAEYHQQELKRVREEAQREAKEAVEKAAKEGAHKMATETAQAMLAKGLSLTLISEITKLEQEVIRSLQESPEEASQKNGTPH